MLYDLDVTGSAVNGYYQSNVLLFQFVHEILLHTVSIVHAMRQSVGCLYAYLGKKTNKHGGRTHPINVVVSKYHHSFIVLFRL